MSFVVLNERMREKIHFFYDYYTSLINHSFEFENIRIRKLNNTNNNNHQDDVHVCNV